MGIARKTQIIDSKHFTAEVQKNVAIFDDFISSNNTNDDFDEITATLGDVDAYIEHQQKMKSGKNRLKCSRHCFMFVLYNYN